jgi:hypothetical protein
MVDKPTRGSIILNKCLTKRPHLFMAISVIESVVKTDYKSVILKSVISELEVISEIRK